MARKSTHPDSKFFDYLSGNTNAAQSKAIEAHLSACDECASAAAFVRALKQAGTESMIESSDRLDQAALHPDVGELASFFYKSARHTAHSRVARHVALCRSCAQQIALYSSGERAASEHTAAKAARGEVPAKAWEMIREWEESGFAGLKPASEVLTQELLERLSSALKTGEHGPPESTGERVPVIVISRSGEVRSVEYFERAVDSTGAQVLRHSLGSERFDNRLVHAVLDVGGSEPVVVSELVKSASLRIERVPRFEELRRVDYFILDETED